VKFAVRIHPQAKEELRLARDYYWDIDPGLAVRLLGEHDIALRYIMDFPNAGSLLFSSYRHVVLPHFPYMIIYLVIDDLIYVLSLVHTHRDPEWMKRTLDNRIT